MKKILPIVMVLGLLFTSIAAAQEAKVFSVYTDKNASDNHYIPSGWIGDYGDVRMNDQCAIFPHSGATCIEFIYTAKESQKQGWAGVRWQNPPNNWGSKKGGYNLKNKNKLTFWARGAKGGEKIQKFVIGGIKGTYPDSAEVELGPVELTDTWQEYTINLTGKDLSYISGGFGWVATADMNPDGATFYIDDIKFESDSFIKAEAKKEESMPFYVYSDSRTIKNHYIASGWMGDHGDIRLERASRENPYLGNTCIKVVYSAKSSQGAGWAGIYWQNPANNWGDVDGGYDLSRARKLTFWARGAKGGERIEEIKIGGIMGNYSDSDMASIGPVILTPNWQEYTIDLNGKDLTSIIGGFCFVTNVDVNPEGATFYFDEIKYE